MKGRHEGMKKGEIDPIVDDRIERAIEQLEEHIPPTLVHYYKFISAEQEWVAEQIRRRGIIPDGMFGPLPE